MQVTTSYNGATLAGQVTAQSVSTTETDMLLVTDLKYSSKSYLTVYIDLDLSGGTINSVVFRVYVTYGAGSSPVWYPVAVPVTATGILTDLPPKVDSSSYAYTSGKYRVAFSLLMPSAAAFKVTATGAGSSTATLNTLTAVVRDN